MKPKNKLGGISMPYYFLLMAVLVVIDQTVKYITVQNIGLNQVHEFIPSILSFTNLRNNGAAWSILSGQQWLFTIITIIALVVIGYFLWHFRASKMYGFSIAFILAGTIGNFIDRIRLGYVVDMFQLDFINFPIFNIADSCLTIGVIWLIITVWLEGDDENAK